MDRQRGRIDRKAELAVERQGRGVGSELVGLGRIDQREGLTISAIGERLALEPSTIIPAVKRLKAAGFLSRRRSTVDERLVEVHLTAKGHELHPKTGCLTDVLLRHSGCEIPQMIELNRSIQALRQGMRKATEGQQAAMEEGHRE
ncbi:MarR family transcriptional regulator [Bosea sp. Root483D1]|uniref:MarR family transcriptional regulator n=1 Tax=Bosea sp. Root483D1 TaxID=1736544 RepID=UPI0009E76AF5|nr:MarR family transcriptional regulator [Bosea sp. Root483D1]